MDNQHPLTPEGFRTAAYLAARERLDLKDKLKCNPPNRPCGDRCIPPNWKCRVKGEGTDSHSRVVAGDPLAGAASIARGRARLAKGLRTGNVVEIQAGRAAIARGVVKAVPGQNLKQKQALRQRVESAIIPIATGLFAAWAIRQGHEGAKILFPAYAKGPARDIENAAGSAIGFVLDRVPVYGSYRQAQRENAAIQAQVLGRAVNIGIKRNPEISESGGEAYIAVSRQKIAGLRSAIDEALNAKTATGVVAGYSSFRSKLLSGVMGANDKGQSLYAEPATISLMAKKYGIEPSRLIGADNTAKKEALITRVAARLADASDSMRSDMAVRGLDYRKPADVDRYTEIASLAASNRFSALTPEQRKEAFSTLKGKVREIVAPSKSPNIFRSIAVAEYNESTSSYNEYFKQATQRVSEDTSPALRVLVAASAGSPVRATLIATAERLKSRVGITAPITGANHAELVLQKLYHERAVPGNYKKDRKQTWLASDADIKYAAQDLGWDGNGGISAAYGVLQRSGQFPNLALRPSDVARTITTPPSPPTETTRPARRRRLIAAYIKAGYSEEAARRKAAEAEANLKQDGLDEIPRRVQAYLQRKAAWIS